MSAHVMGLHHILALTGDPARVGDQPGATSVYDLNSFGLVELIRKFNRGVNNAGMPLGRPTRFTVGVAFNPNGRNLPGQVARLRKKVACGAHFAMTQPVYDAERFDQMAAGRLRRAWACPILVGVMPLLSERNAEFLHNEVPGISLTDDARRRMKGLSGKEGRARRPADLQGADRRHGRPGRRLLHRPAPAAAGDGGGAGRLHPPARAAARVKARAGITSSLTADCQSRDREGAVVSLLLTVAALKIRPGHNSGPPGFQAIRHQPGPDPRGLSAVISRP